ncbi:GTPase [Candidatus Shikimatogenerans silvanidophilus]|uniref:GTPase n=1 Tax=Candidatus Shikimatogenerans silvanidophilus TaxID=2782547 RepID=UPI001BAA793B|nr:GTPase [Candidatus Shikimatogenerans silvanidophilus]
MQNKNFLDFIKIFCKSGDGGKGLIHFYKKKSSSRYIPDGGNGGNGGNIFIKGNDKLYGLNHLKKIFLSENGKNGKPNNITGSNGKNIFIEVPIKTIVKNENNKILFIINNNNEKKILFYGGIGKKGNCYKKKNKIKKNIQKNFLKKNNNKGKSGFFILECYIYSDVALLGFTNSGKSTLLSVITSAKPKIGNYSYTTTKPNFGIFYYNNNSFLILDYPGFLKKSKKGCLKFIKHIKNNKLILLILSLDSNNIKNDYFFLLKIIKYYLNDFFLKKKYILVFSKLDIIKNKEEKNKINKIIKELKINKYIFISSIKKYGISLLKEKINKELLSLNLS